jgi:hypothetical protein
VAAREENADEELLLIGERRQVRQNKEALGRVANRRSMAERGK